MRKTIIETKRLKMITPKEEDREFFHEIIGYAGIFNLFHYSNPNHYELSFPNAIMFATSHADNLASIKVLEKVGMKFIEKIKMEGRGDRLIYRL